MNAAPIYAPTESNSSMIVKDNNGKTLFADMTKKLTMDRFKMLHAKAEEMTGRKLGYIYIWQLIEKNGRDVWKEYKLEQQAGKWIYTIMLDGELIFDNIPRA